MKQSIVFITGPCAAGKSTVGKLLSQHKSFEKAAFLQVDELRRIVWQGYAPPFPETEDSRKQLKLAARAASRIAKLYCEAGFFVFVEEVMEPWLISIYEEELEQCPQKTICLLPTDVELLKRDRERPAAEQMRERCLDLWKSFQEWSKKEDWFVIDPTGQKPDETVEKIISQLSL